MWRERRSNVEGGWNGGATLIIKRCDRRERRSDTGNKGRGDKQAS